jgi:hypothetical protein
MTLPNVTIIMPIRNERSRFRAPKSTPMVMPYEWILPDESARVVSVGRQKPTTNQEEEAGEREGA